MLVFIVPIKSPSVSNSWSRLCKLFERCIASICNQTSPNFKVIVVCHQIPEISFESSYIEYIEVDFPPPALDSKFGQVQGPGDIDKARKIRVGLEAIQHLNASHVMVVDADDCVNQDLAAFVDQYPQCVGWYFKQGYVYLEGSWILFKNIQNFYQSCGTSIIARKSLFELLFLNENYYNHNNYQLAEDITLLPLPMIGAIYSVNNKENMFMGMENLAAIGGTTNKLIFSVINKLKKYRIQIITPKIKNKFGLYRVT